MNSAIVDVIITEPEGHGDERGKFYETYRRSWFPLGREMVQSNRSDRSHGCVVGFHYHIHQSDYWTVPKGVARVVLHDLRLGSSTSGVTEHIVVSAENCRGVYIPPGVAHGFAALEDLALIYLVDQYYNPRDELGVAWDDPDIDAQWGIVNPILSERDQNNPHKAEILHLPHIGLRT